MLKTKPYTRNQGRDFQQPWGNGAWYKALVRADLGCCAIQTTQPKRATLDLEHQGGSGGRLGPRGDPQSLVPLPLQKATSKGRGEKNNCLGRKTMIPRGKYQYELITNTIKMDTEKVSNDQKEEV